MGAPRMAGTSLVSFDGTERCDATLRTPPDRGAWRALLDTQDTITIRGSGLSYCQASAAPGAVAVSTRAFDRVLDLDEQRGTIRVEAGITIGALLRHVVERGWWFPVLPGHPQITVGGCAAFNTHGKTQHDIGSFVDHIDALTLFHPDHGEIECGPTHERELFLLTVGGMGLTGWITELTLRLQPLPAPMIRREARPAADFLEAVAVMEAGGAPGTHLYSWNDATRSGDRFGHGVVYAERFVAGERPARARYRELRADDRGRLVPVPVWNRATATVVNRAFAQIERRRRRRVLPALDAAFPINGKEGYFHAFGPRGLHEYQFIVPRDTWPETVARVQNLIRRRRACITLSSLKLFRGERRHLWFRADGICLTLDAPATVRTRRLFADLDELAAELNAPVNLAKDSRLTAAAVRRIFPGYDDFRRCLREFDPARRIDSALRRRIDV